MNANRLKTYVLWVAIIIIGIGSLACSMQTPKELPLAQLIKEGAVLIDVRSIDEFKEGSVTGAINIPINLLPYCIETIDTTKHVIIFCKSGNRAGKAKKILEENHITDVTNGGSWQNVQEAVDKSAASEVK